MRQFQVRRIWKGRLPPENPGCLSDEEWTALTRHVNEGLPAYMVDSELLHDASTALLIYYAFEREIDTERLKNELNRRLGIECGR